MSCSTTVIKFSHINLMQTLQRIEKYLNTVHLQSYITTEQMYAYIIDTYIIK